LFINPKGLQFCGQLTNCSVAPSAIRNAGANSGKVIYSGSPAICKIVDDRNTEYFLRNYKQNNSALKLVLNDKYHKYKKETNEFNNKILKDELFNLEKYNENKISEKEQIELNIKNIKINIEYLDRNRLKYGIKSYLYASRCREILKKKEKNLIVINKEISSTEIRIKKTKRELSSLQSKISKARALMTERKIDDKNDAALKQPKEIAPKPKHESRFTVSYY
jgi:hypothetical protein